MRLNRVQMLVPAVVGLGHIGSECLPEDPRSLVSSNQLEALAPGIHYLYLAQLISRMVSAVTFLDPGRGNMQIYLGSIQ